MKKVTRIEFILKQGCDFHEDFIMKIPDINIYKEFDSYYFWPINSVLGKEKSEVIAGLSKYFNECIERLKNLMIGENVFIPIEFSDQYYGGFMVHLKEGGIMNIHWGTIQDINTAVFETKNGQLYHNLSDREFDKDFTFEMNKQDFIDSFIFFLDALRYMHNL